MFFPDVIIAARLSRNWSNNEVEVGGGGRRKGKSNGEEGNLQNFHVSISEIVFKPNTEVAYEVDVPLSL